MAEQITKEWENGLYSLSVDPGDDSVIYTDDDGLNHFIPLDVFLEVAEALQKQTRS